MEADAAQADAVTAAAPCRLEQVDGAGTDPTTVATLVVWDNGLATTFDANGQMVPELSGPWVLARDQILSTIFREPQGPRSFQFHLGLPYQDGGEEARALGKCQANEILDLATCSDCGQRPCTCEVAG